MENEKIQEERRGQFQYIIDLFLPTFCPVFFSPKGGKNGISYGTIQM